jgi:hypothetical protein
MNASVRGKKGNRMHPSYLFFPRSGLYNKAVHRLLSEDAVNPVDPGFEVGRSAFQ